MVLKLTLGGMDDAFTLKNLYRIKYNLPEITENPSLILNKMTPATPPPNPIDIVNELQLSNPNSSYKRKKVTKKNELSKNKLILNFNIIINIAN